MKQELINLRQEMAKHNIDAYLIPTTDYHGSEYVNNYFKCRAFISGFTGSAGTLVVTQDEAKLWTDGRYFIQCTAQLEGSGIDMMKMNDETYPTVIEYLEKKLTSGQCLGFDGRVVSGDEGRDFEERLEKNGVTLCDTIDLVDIVWTDRPAVKPSKIYSLPLSVTGLETAQKLADVRKEMASEKADYHLITNMEEIAWLLNLRGDDVANTPVFFAFALISQEEANIYLYKEALDAGLIDESLFTVKDYLEVQEDLTKLPAHSTLWAYETLANYTFLKKVPKTVEIINKNDPIELMKSIKNETEIKSTLNAHIKDGVAMVNFLYWLKTNIANGMEITEVLSADYLEECRRAQDGCFDLSFTTIAGYAEHGAIVHYDPTPETDIPLKPEGLLLVDSGGQYNDGTTDITRTIALGPLSDKMIKYYSLVLSSHIELAIQRFAPGTSGESLDIIARVPLRENGLDFNHGTGHGVGHILSVHEDPNNISPRNGKQPILPGMITSDEPGVYIENEFGIRLENEILCKEAEDGKYVFESITFCPFDRAAIDSKYLTADQLKWLNNYHQLVYAVLAPHLEENVKEWLKTETALI